MNLKLPLILSAIAAAPVSADIIAHFSAEFPTSTLGPGQSYSGTESPSAGWNYLWNPDGVVGTAANYQSLVPNTVPTWPNFGGVSPMFTNLDSVAFNSTDQGNFRYGLPANQPGGKLFGRLQVTKP